MNVYPDKLGQFLQTRELAGVYFLSGDEPLGVRDAGDLIRAAAMAAGFSEREVIFAQRDEDWQQLIQAAASLSLFAEKRLIEVRLPTGKPGATGAKVLREYAATPAQDVLLLITSAGLDGAARRSAWFKALDAAGVTVTVKVPEAAQLPAWIERRMRAASLQPSSDAVALIAERVEGNLLAAEQEIERLSLLHPGAEIDTEQVLSAVADSARFSIPAFVDAAMQGVPLRALRVLRGLQDEGVSEVLVLWYLSSEIRAATRVAESLQNGMSPAASFKAAGIWQSRQAQVQLALSRHTAATWMQMLSRTAHIDRMSKGREAGHAWDALADLSVLLSTGNPGGMGGVSINHQ